MITPHFFDIADGERTEADAADVSVESGFLAFQGGGGGEEGVEIP